ncbi:Phox homologous domain [Arabidopsis suecica]|uniref:Phox homologous domain n=1 Tax=Arabidopsis suecica TaxID=45249 RepID=A0A8T2AJ92_ARASU|nr:Phox homologous domain [Arabidopsis suecica]
MQRRSPPKHRHDGTSPLPLGMDWSPPPRNWNGRDTVWPHDFRTGWSYCVTVPSWTLLATSKNSDPVVFYRVQVSVQSLEGVTTTRRILKRFNDFLKLLADLKRAFPKQSFPSAPPRGILRVKSREMLEERRYSLEDWMTKLLSNIELARSVVVASFLELEATARSACQVVDQNVSDSNDDGNITSLSSLVYPNLSFLHSGGSSLLSSDYSSDTAYETSELGSASLVQDDVSETGTGDLTLDEDLTNPTEKLVKFTMSNIDKGLNMSQTIIEQLDDFPKHRVHLGYANDITEANLYNGKASKGVFRANDDLRRLSESETGQSVMHDRKLSAESINEFPSLAGETSISGIQLDVHHGISVGNLEMPGSGRIVLPLKMHNKLNRILLTMNERLLNSKTDMEDLIARLNQETAVKEYLNRKVDDLEVELEITKQRNKENLEQALMTERQSVTQMQWDIEELRQKTFEMELKLKSKADGSSHAKSSGNSTIDESHELLQEMDATKQQLEDLSRRYVELESKSKADIKVLVREVKSLRRSHMELEKELSRSLTEKSDTEKLLQQERKIVENKLEARKKLVSDCKILHDRLKVNNTNLSMGEQCNLREDLSEVSNALQGQIEVQLLLGFDETASEDELKKIMADIYAENINMKKHVSSAMRVTSSLKDENEKHER